jgi:DNA-binding transcriptional regulator YhcF (GntR family)
MNGLARHGDGLLTLRQFAKTTGVSYRTAAAYAQKAGWTRNGKTTYLTPEQQTIIIEAVKQPVSSGTKANLAAQTQGIETALTPALRLEMLYRQIDEIKTAEITRLNTELSQTRYLLETRTAGLETIQRIAEAGGLIMSDREDVLATYRRGRG